MFKLRCKRHYRNLATYSWFTTWRNHVTKTAPARRRHSVGGAPAAAHGSSLGSTSVYSTTACTDEASVVCDKVRSSAAVGSRESSLNTSLGSRLQQLTAVSADVTQCKVRMAHYKGTIVAVKLCSSHYPACVTHSLAHLFTYLLTYLLASPSNDWRAKEQHSLVVTNPKWPLSVTLHRRRFISYCISSIFVYFRLFSFIFVSFRLLCLGQPLYRRYTYTDTD